MKNNRIHYIIIPVLMVLFAVYSFKRIHKGKEISSKMDTEMSYPLVQIGNCYSYREGDNYYGVIIVEVAKDHIISVGILEEVKKQIFAIRDFERGKLIYAKSEILKGYPVIGLWKGFFSDEDLKIFNENFQFVGKLELDKSKLEENGGGTLISGSQINLRKLQNPNFLKSFVIYREPVENVLKNNVE